VNAGEVIKAMRDRLDFSTIAPTSCAPSGTMRNLDNDCRHTGLIERRRLTNRECVSEVGARGLDPDRGGASDFHEARIGLWAP
jgi:hypothetical protein